MSFVPDPQDPTRHADLPPPVTTSPLGGVASTDPSAALGDSSEVRRLLAEMGLTSKDALNPYTLNALAVLYALKSQKEKERAETPFPQPGKAMAANSGLVPPEHAPSGTVFTGGSAYQPNYGAQNVAAAGMLVSNILDAYKKNRERAQQAPAPTSTP